MRIHIHRKPCKIKNRYYVNPFQQIKLLKQKKTQLNVYKIKLNLLDLRQTKTTKLLEFQCCL